MPWGFAIIGSMGKRKNKGWVRRVLQVVAGCVIAVALVVAGTNVAMVLMTRDGIVDTEAAADYHADAIVVLGASVLADGSPSGILQDRLDDGIALYFAGAAPKIIMSGDNGTASYNEVLSMKNYAVSKGVPSDDVFCDHAGFSTYESMYRAKYVFGADRIVIATQTYHLYRSLYVARGLGMEAIGVPSDYHEYGGQLLFSAREIPARTKDFFKFINGFRYIKSYLIQPGLINPELISSGCCNGKYGRQCIDVSVRSGNPSENSRVLVNQFL